MKLRHAFSAIACATLLASARAQSSTDLWDLLRGSYITASSELNFWAGSPGGLLGENGQNNYDASTWTYFNDGMPEGFVHFVEWETAADVTIQEIRVHAVGNGPDYLNSRECDQIVIKAKSPGSDIYDLTLLTYTPTHPYTFLDPSTFLVVDQTIAPVTARSFRAEFKQYTSGTPWDGPCIVEIDAFGAPTKSIPSVSNDLWDVSQGVTVTATTPINPMAGTTEGMFGFSGQNNFDGSTWTYFDDFMPADTVHAIEWQTPGDVTVGEVRLYAVGDYGPGWNNGREFAQFTLKTKSPGSATFDVTLLTFTPEHPYAFVDPDSFLVVDATITPVTASAFRAEFVQYSAGNGYDGPRIVELDALAPLPPPPPPPSDPPPSDPPPTTNPPPSDPPPSNPPPSDPPPPSNPPPSDPPPSNPPPSDPPPSDPPPSNPPPSDPPPSNPPPSDPPPSNPPPSDPPPSNPPPSDPPPSNPPPSDPPPVTPPPVNPPPSDPPTPPPPPPPPVVVTQPQSVTANYLTPVALWVEATGSAPLQYQWFKDGGALNGVTGQTLYVAALTSSDVGTYHVTVTDANGSVTSTDASLSLDLVNILPSAFDAWDSHMGAVITAHSDYSAVGTAYGMFGGGSSADDSSATYFADNQPAFVEWTTPAAVQVNAVRLFASGGNHELGKFTLRAKSAGSATFDVLVGTFTPSHPYTLLDATTFAILDTEITPVVATAFRAEFDQYNADGPRVLELDAFSTRPEVVPAVVVNPQPQTAAKKAKAVFSVVARGGALKYQWKFNGGVIPGATAATLCVDTLKRPDQGNYSVVVSNDLGSVESAAAFLTITNRK